MVDKHAISNVTNSVGYFCLDYGQDASAFLNFLYSLGCSFQSHGSDEAGGHQAICRIGRAGNKVSVWAARGKRVVLRVDDRHL